MPTEEEIRRRCIIDPDSCAGGPPPPAAVDPGENAARMLDALGEELWVAYKSPHDQPWSHLSPDHQAPWKRQAEALLLVWEFRLLGGPDHKALHEKAIAELSVLQDDHESKLAEIESLKSKVEKLKTKAKKAESDLSEPESTGEPGTAAVGED